MELTIYQVIFLYNFRPDPNYVPSNAFMQNKNFIIAQSIINYELHLDITWH